MITIGIRQLRQRASEYIALVKRSKTVRIFECGRPVALAVPNPTGGAIERLEAKGRLSPAHGDLLECWPPSSPSPSAPLPSEKLETMRDAER